MLSYLIMNKIAIIMVNINDYEYYREFNELENRDKVDWYYFTDKNISSKFWNIKNINNINYLQILDNRLKCKFIKMNTHLILPHYQYYFWIDGAFPILNNNLINDLYSFINQNQELILYIHNARRKERNTKYEVIRCSKLKSVSNKLINKQYQNYILEGYPDKKGVLFSSGIIFKKNIKKINDMMEFWFKQNEMYTTRDQVSLPYSLWKCQVNPSKIINENINLNSLVGKKEMKSRRIR